MFIKSRDDDGFTLVEILTVVLILAVLVAIAVLSYIVSTNNARSVTCRQNQRTLSDAVSVYEAEHDAKPTTIDDLEPYVHNFDDVVECPNHDGTRLEYDPATEQVTCDNHPR